MYQFNLYINAYTILYANISRPDILANIYIIINY